MANSTVGAKSLEEVTKPVNQKYSTNPEDQKAFRPRFEAQANTTLDATKDIDSLLSSKASRTKQEYMVNATIAKSMAADHITKLQQNIANINDSMGPTDNREKAILDLQGQIASASSVTAGLTGDAAQAYDQAFLPSAKEMSTAAFSKWKGQQKDLDEAHLKSEFSKFVNQDYTNMSPSAAKITLGVWKSRLASLGDGSKNAADGLAADAIVRSIVSEAKQDPTLTARQIANKFINRQFMGEAEVDKDGRIKYNSSNPETNAKIATVLNAIFENANREDASNLKSLKAARDKRMTELGKLWKAAKDSGEDKTEAGRAKLAAKWAEIYEGSGVGPTGLHATGDIVDDITVTDRLTGIESAGRYDIWNGNKNYRQYGSDEHGNPYSSAYGRYQFIKARAEELWKEAQKAGTIPKDKGMFHGKQTPEEQDAMWAEQLKHLRKSVDSLGIAQSFDNLYMIHQLGEGGARAFLKGTQTDKMVEAMNAQLGKQRLDNPLDDIASVRAIWMSKYRKNSGANMIDSITPEMSPQEADLVATIAKGKTAQSTEEMKVAKERLTAKDTLRDEKMSTLVDSIEKIVDTDPSTYNYNELKFAMRDVNRADVAAGRKETFSKEDLAAAKNAQKVRTLVRNKAVAEVMAKDATKTHDAKEAATQKEARDAVAEVTAREKRTGATKFTKSEKKKIIKAENRRRAKIGLSETFNSPEYWSAENELIEQTIAANDALAELSLEQFNEKEKAEVEEAKANIENIKKLMEIYPDKEDTYLLSIFQEMEVINNISLKNDPNRPVPFPDSAKMKTQVGLAEAKTKRDREASALQVENEKAAYKAAYDKELEKDKKMAAVHRKNMTDNAPGANKIYADFQKAMIEKYKDLVGENPWDMDFTPEIMEDWNYDMLQERLGIAKLNEEQVKKHEDNQKRIIRESKTQQLAMEIQAKENPSKRKKLYDWMRAENDKYAKPTTTTDANGKTTTVGPFLTADIYQEADILKVKQSIQTYDETKQKQEIDAIVLRVGKQDINEVERGDMLFEALKGISYVSEQNSAYATRIIENQRATDKSLAARPAFAQMEALMKDGLDNRDVEKIHKLKNNVTSSYWDNNIAGPLEAYAESEDKKVNDAIDAPLGKKHYNTDFTKPDSYKKVFNNKMNKLGKLVANIRAGNDGGESIKQFTDLYGKDIKLSAQTDLQREFAFNFIQTNMKSLDAMNKSMKSDRVLWSNPSFIAAARINMTDEEEVTFVSKRYVIESMRSEEYGPTLNATVERATTATMMGTSMKDANGDDTDYKKSTQLTTFLSDVEALTDIPYDERQALIMTARIFDKMGQPALIKTIQANQESKYQKGKLSGRLSANGLEGIRSEAKGSDQRMAAMVHHDLVKTYKLPQAQAHEFAQLVVSGDYVMNKDVTGATIITFADINGKYTMNSTDFIINADYLAIHTDPYDEFEEGDVRDIGGTPVIIGSHRDRRTKSTRPYQNIKVRYLSRAEIKAGVKKPQPPKLRKESSEGKSLWWKITNPSAYREGRLQIHQGIGEEDNATNTKEDNVTNTQEDNVTIGKEDNVTIVKEDIEKEDNVKPNTKD